MIEINDPNLHLQYVRRCAGLGVPLFLDKPLAQDLAAGLEIARIAAEHDLRVCSASSLRFARPGSRTRAPRCRRLGT